MTTSVLMVREGQSLGLWTTWRDPSTMDWHAVQGVEHFVLSHTDVILAFDHRMVKEAASEISTRTGWRRTPDSQCRYLAWYWPSLYPQEWLT